MAKKNFYAVKTGCQPGIYSSWAECEKQVKGYPGAQFQGFQTLEEAQAWLGPVFRAPKEESVPGRREASGLMGTAREADSDFPFRARAAAENRSTMGGTAAGDGSVRSGGQATPAIRRISGAASGGPSTAGKPVVRNIAQSRPRAYSNRKIRPQDLNEEQRAAFPFLWLLTMGKQPRSRHTPGRISTIA